MTRWKSVEGLLVLGSWLALAGSSAGQTSAGQTSAGQTAGGDSMDVTITHAVIDAAGQPAGPPMPPLSYRIERVRTDEGWRTRVTYRTPSATWGRGRLDGARVEYDEDSGKLSITDESGKSLPVPALDPLAAPLPAGGGGLADRFLITPAGRSERRRQLEARFGPSNGKVRGLDRFVLDDGETSEEVLADADGVPIEINVASGGRLERHVRFEYDKRPGGALSRRSTRSERLLADGRRALTIVSFEPVVAGR